MAIVDVDQIMDEALGKQKPGLDVDALMDEELAEDKPYDPRTAYEQPAHLQGRKTFSDPDVQQTIREDLVGAKQGVEEFALNSADLAVAMLGGSGIAEAVGVGVENPVSALTTGEELKPIPSLAEDVKEGRTLDTTLKTVGVAGDALQLGGAYLAATGAGAIPGGIMIGAGTSLKFGARAYSKYGDQIADGLRKLFDLDPEAAEKVAERIDTFADEDKPVGAALGTIKEETKKLRRGRGIGGNSQPPSGPRETAQPRDLGLFNRAEEAALNLDIPERGIRGDALLRKLIKDPDVPNDEVEFGLGLLVKPDDIFTKDDIRKLFSTASERGYLAEFGLEERVRMQDPTQITETDSVKKAQNDLEYENMEDYRYPDEPGSNYSEYTYHLRPSAKQSEVGGADRKEKLQLHIDRTRTANAALSDPDINLSDTVVYEDSTQNIYRNWDDTDSLRELYRDHHNKEYGFDIDGLSDEDVRLDMLTFWLKRLDRAVADEHVKVRNRTGVTPKGLLRTRAAINDLKGKVMGGGTVDYMGLSQNLNPAAIHEEVARLASNADGIDTIDADVFQRLENFQKTGTFLTDSDVDEVAGSSTLFRGNKHFYRDSENQLFHMRTSTRTTSEGKRVLLIEEIQSDTLSGAKAGATNAEVPFKNEGYMNLALARAMRIAAEQGLDGVALTNAAAQIERNRGGFANVFDEMTSTFGKSETGEDVATVFLSQEGNVKTRLTVDRKSGLVVGASQSDLEGKPLSEVIDSRETAKRLIEEEGSIPVAQRVVGEDGYKTVYDKKLPSKMRKIVNRMNLNDSVGVTRSNIFVGGREVYPDFAGLDDEFDPDLFEEMMEAFEDDANIPASLLSTQIARMGMRMYGMNIEEFTRLLEKKYGLDQFGNDYDIDPDYLDLTYEDVFDVGRMASNDRDRNIFAVELQRAFPDKFSDITDAEDFVDLALEQGAASMNPGRNFEDWVMQKKNMVGEPITVKDNHTIIFTDEMKQQILDKGLPRLRKGGLAQKKAPRQ